MRTFVLSTVFLFACAGAKPAADKPATGTAAAATASAGSLTQAERDQAVKDLEDTRRAFLASINGLSDAQFRYKPAPDRWSVAEVAEHIAVSEDTLRGMITDKIMKSPVVPGARAQVQMDDQRLRQGVLDRTTKRQAPEMLRPSGRFPTVDAVRAAFGESRDKTVAYVQTTTEDMRAHVAPHPVLQALDGYQWILLLAGHTARHTAQIEEVKADPKFPR